MKLNFVIEISSSDDKHFAFATYEYSNQNLYHIFDKFQNIPKDQHVVCVHYASSKKQAELIAQNWNQTFEKNGTLLKF